MYVRQRWQKCDTADASARGALASGSARQCVSTVAAATRSRLALNSGRARPTLTRRAIPRSPKIPRRSDSVKLGGRRPRAGGRREGVGEPRWFGRPRGSPFHFVSHAHPGHPPTHGARGPGRGRGSRNTPGVSQGQARDGAAHPGYHGRGARPQVRRSQ
jgi:hypothetical protein